MKQKTAIFFVSSHAFKGSFKRVFVDESSFKLLYIYYIKVSGMLSGNNLIKRCDILTCEDIDDFSDIKFVS